MVFHATAGNINMGVCLRVWVWVWVCAHTYMRGRERERVGVGVYETECVSVCVCTHACMCRIETRQDNNFICVQAYSTKGTSIYFIFCEVTNKFGLGQILPSLVDAS